MRKIFTLAVLSAIIVSSTACSSSNQGNENMQDIYNSIVDANLGFEDSNKQNSASSTDNETNNENSNNNEYTQIATNTTEIISSNIENNSEYSMSTDQTTPHNETSDTSSNIDQYNSNSKYSWLSCDTNTADNAELIKTYCNLRLYEYMYRVIINNNLILYSASVIKGNGIYSVDQFDKYLYSNGLDTEDNSEDAETLSTFNAISSEDDLYIWCADTFGFDYKKVVDSILADTSNFDNLEALDPNSLLESETWANKDYVIEYINNFNTESGKFNNPDEMFKGSFLDNDLMITDYIKTNENSILLFNNNFAGEK